MGTFTWTAKGDVGARYDGTFPSHYKKAYDNYYAANFTILSESLLTNGKISYYISGNYNLDIDYKNIRYNDQTGALSYDGYTFELKQYGNYIGTGEASGYFVESLLDLSTIGYLKKEQTYYAESKIEEVINGTFDYEYLGESLSSQRTYYISGDDTFNGTNKGDILYSGPGNDIIYGNKGDDNLDGQSGSDIILGGDGSDVIKGGAGGDSITPGKGNDEIDGGDGVDEVWFSGNFSNYSFSGSSKNLKVSDINSGSNDGINTLKNIEILRFQDKKLNTSEALIPLTSTSNEILPTFNSDIINKITRTISNASQTYFGKSSNYKFYNLGQDRYALKTDSGYDEITGVINLQFSDKTLNLEKDIEGTFDQVTGLNSDSGQMFRLYNAAFARFPDSDGLNYWISKYSSGENDSRAVAQSFLASAEFSERYGANVTDEKYVTTLYQNVLGRAPDTSGLNYWLGQLSSGAETRYEALLGFAESAENKALFTEMTGFG